MSDATDAWRKLTPVPWERWETVEEGSPMLSTYLCDAFRDAFGFLPTDVTYSSFPDGVFAVLVIDRGLEDRHNVWGVLIGSMLRGYGIDINVSVYAMSGFEQVRASVGEQSRSGRDRCLDVAR